MSDSEKAIFNWGLYNWKKYKINICLEKPKSLNCTQVDEFRKTSETERNKKNYYKLEPLARQELDKELLEQTSKSIAASILAAKPKDPDQGEAGSYCAKDETTERRP